MQIDSVFDSMFGSSSDGMNDRKMLTFSLFCFSLKIFLKRKWQINENNKENVT